MLDHLESLAPLPSNTASDEGELRFSQILDERDHKRCADGNKHALLAEKLDRLRALKEEIAKDDWMFSASEPTFSFSG